MIENEEKENVEQENIENGNVADLNNAKENAERKMLKGKDVHRIRDIIFSAAVGSYRSYLLPLHLSSMVIYCRHKLCQSVR